MVERSGNSQVRDGGELMKARAERGLVGRGRGTGPGSCARVRRYLGGPGEPKQRYRVRGVAEVLAAEITPVGR